MLIKICGIRDPETFIATQEAGADLIGLVFYPNSPRAVTIQDVAAWLPTVRKNSTIVALTVNPDDGLLDQLHTHIKPDYIQLHGDETPARTTEIKTRYNTKTIKALNIKSANNINTVQTYHAVDIFLLDAPKQGTVRGGTGHSFDWNLLRNVDIEQPWLLAGGLTPHNIANAITQLKPPGVDVSSGVESSKGIKDIALIQQFITNARAADAQ